MTPLRSESQQSAYSQEDQTAPTVRKKPFIVGLCVALILLGGILAFGKFGPIPVISGVNAATVTDSTVIIIWTTDIISSSQVEYGVTTNYGFESAVDLAPVNTHSITLHGLTSKTTYHCRVKSKGPNWYDAVSSDLTFTTN